MKKFYAWIVVDNTTGEPLITAAHPHIFWLRKVAQDFIKSSWGELSAKRILITEFSYARSQIRQRKEF